MLVAAYDEMRSSNPGIQLKKDQLRGIEINPRMAALAVSNMILRGISAEAVVLGNTFLYSEDKKYDNSHAQTSDRQSRSGSGNR